MMERESSKQGAEKEVGGGGALVFRWGAAEPRRAQLHLQEDSVFTPIDGCRCALPSSDGFITKMGLELLPPGGCCCSRLTAS